MSTAQAKRIQCSWVLADDVRTESTGKHLVIGLYATPLLLLEMPAGDPDPSKEQGASVEGIALMCTVQGFKGTLDAIFSLRDDRLALDDVPKLHVRFTASTELTPVTMVVRVRPLRITSLGIKVAALEFPDLGIVETFELVVARRTIGQAWPHQGSVEILETTEPAKGNAPKPGKPGRKGVIDATSSRSAAARAPAAKAKRKPSRKNSP